MHTCINTCICCKVKDSQIKLRRTKGIWSLGVLNIFKVKYAKNWQGDPHLKFRKGTLELLWTSSGIVYNYALKVARRVVWFCIFLTFALVLAIRQIFCAQRSFYPFTQVESNTISLHFHTHCILYSLCQSWYTNSKILFLFWPASTTLNLDRNIWWIR